MLVAGQISWAEGICLGDNGDQVHSGAESLHDLDIQRLQGMSGRSDEVEACVDTEIDLVNTAGLLLLQHVGLMLIIQELDNWHPRVAVVDIVAETRCVDNGQSDYQLLEEHTRHSN